MAQGVWLFIYPFDLLMLCHFCSFPTIVKWYEQSRPWFSLNTRFTQLLDTNQTSTMSTTLPWHSFEISPPPVISETDQTQVMPLKTLPRTSKQQPFARVKTTRLRGHSWTLHTAEFVLIHETDLDLHTAKFVLIHETDLDPQSIHLHRTWIQI